MRWALLLAGLGLAGAAPAATVTIQVMDAVGEGFHDTTPFTPIGGNNATTLGQARLNVFNEAARLWGQLINSSVTIVVEARFDPLTCSASSGVLGSAGPTWIFHDFPNAPLPDVFYPAALADALAGNNLAGTNGNGTQYGFTDISATFNSTVNGTAGCLGSSYFYYGFDHQLTGHNDGRSYIADLRRRHQQRQCHATGGLRAVRLRGIAGHVLAAAERGAATAVGNRTIRQRQRRAGLERGARQRQPGAAQPGHQRWRPPQALRPFQLRRQLVGIALGQQRHA